MQYPTRFTLGALTWTVEEDNNLLDRLGFYGTTNYADQKVRYQTQTGSTKLQDDLVELIIKHELVHVILEAMGEHELNKNEKFVDLFARFLIEYEKTVEYGKRSKKRSS